LPVDFAGLQLPPETRNYVPRLIAVKQIVLRPASFYVALPAVPNTKYFTTVARAANVDLSHAARLADMGMEEFKALNPAYDYKLIKASAPMSLLVPIDRAQSFADRLDAYLTREAQSRKPHRPNSRH